jgi:hypothetical protein
MDYNDISCLVQIFRDADVVLNFIVDQTDREGKIGKLLVDAAIEARVRRYAPSAWAAFVLSPSSHTQRLLWANKVNSDAKVANVIDRVPWYKSKLESTWEVCIRILPLFFQYLNKPTAARLLARDNATARAVATWRRIEKQYSYRRERSRISCITSLQL